MRRRDLSKVSIEDTERRMRIALAKMSARQGDILLAIRFDKTSYHELATRHGITVEEVTEEFARALGIWSRCLHARLPWLVWPWL
ncbi:hypothetical protein [Sphingopyxis sp. 113P3]|uniref:hypothetical protein n=1 Tax=Sphingopyxis sp. (strain 113P3) TaxID=292913 RepID=UPI0006AD0F3D|nr:hypothetical protein [Sphingopyxis sp. 113P3]ALC12130.1 solute carrier family 12 (sodium/chloride transporter), member 3 [Sphingopyxis sp. 113P3]